jgi:Leucine-rich repeat (LRR) protein
MDDVVGVVFGFLELGQLIRCALVCKLFNRVFHKEIVWKRLIDYKYNGIDFFNVNYCKTFKVFYSLGRNFKNYNVKKLWNKKEIDFGSLKLTHINPDIEYLKHISTLSFFTNNISLIPSQLCQLINLNSLVLSCNKITSLPTEIGYLTNLKRLYLFGNKLITLPEELCSLPNLKMLNVSDNYINILPTYMGNLTKLTKLYLHGNNYQNENKWNDFKSVPSEFGNLHNLKILYLHNKNIISLPNHLTNLQNLHTISLTKNQPAPIFINPPRFLHY